MRTLLTLLVFFYSSLLNAQEKKKDFAYSIVFASCFYNDIVGLKINGESVIADSKVTSDPGLGITQLGVYQDSDSVWVSNNQDKEKRPIIIIQDSLLLDVMVNGHWKSFTMELKKGKIIFIDHCFVKEGEQRKQKLTLKQYNETVQLY